MNWQFSNDAPIYAQLIGQIRAGIVSGAFSPGERLPSVRDLAMEAGVNPNTMQRALTELERDGLVEAYQQEAPTGRMRKYYHLTRKGGAALRSEAEAWRAYSGAVNAVLRSSPGLNLA